MARKAKGVGAYTNNNPGLTRQDWSERQGEMGVKRNLFQDVNKNSDEARGGFSGPIKYGTDE